MSNNFKKISQYFKIPSLIYSSLFILGALIGVFSMPRAGSNQIQSLNLVTINNFVHIVTKNALIILLIYISIIFTNKIAYFIYAQNGLLLGITCAWIIKISPKLLLLIIPHGIFEIPCILATGFILTKGELYIRENFRKCSCIFLIHISAVILIAAIEVFCTPLLWKLTI